MRDTGIEKEDVFMRHAIILVLALVPLRWTTCAAESDNSGLALQLTGEVTAEFQCRLECDCRIKVPAGKLRLVREDESGTIVEMSVKGDDNPSVWVDQAVEKGRTYSYYTTCSLDDYYASNIVVLTVGTERARPPKHEVEFHVEVFGTPNSSLLTHNEAYPGNVFIAGARLPQPGGILTWTPLDEESLTVLAQDDDRVLMRVETVPYDPDVNVRVSYQLGKNEWEGFYTPWVVSGAGYVAHQVSDAEVGRLTEDRDALRRLVRNTFRIDNFSRMGMVPTESLLKKIGRPAISELKSWYDVVGNRRVRHRLYGIMANTDWDHVRTQWGNEFLKHGDNETVNAFIMASLPDDKEHRSPDLFRAIAAGLENKESYARYVTVTALGNWGTDTALTTLDGLKCSDPSPSVRFWAAKAARAIRHKERLAIPDFPPFPLRTPSPDNIRQAHIFLDKVIQEVSDCGTERKMESVERGAHQGKWEKAGETKRPTCANDMHRYITPGSSLAKLALFPEAAVAAFVEKIEKSPPYRVEMFHVVEWINGLLGYKRQVDLDDAVEGYFWNCFVNQSEDKRLPLLKELAKTDILECEKDFHTRVAVAAIKDAESRKRLRALLYSLLLIKFDKTAKGKTSAQIGREISVKAAAQERELAGHPEGRSFGNYRSAYWYLRELQKGSDVVARTARQLVVFPSE